MNIVILCGRLGKDPEARTTSTGTKIVNFTLATTEHSGEKEYTEWHNLVAFGKTAETVEKYLKKGDQITAQGRLKTSSYEDKSGSTRYKTEIILDRFEFGSQKREAQVEEIPISEIPF